VLRGAMLAHWSTSIDFPREMRLVRLSSRGMRIMAPESGYDIPSERPDAVIDAARELYASIRRSSE
jgi:hypothetical protein